MNIIALKKERLLSRVLDKEFNETLDYHPDTKRGRKRLLLRAYELKKRRMMERFTKTKPLLKYH